jgi:putative membrane protein
MKYHLTLLFSFIILLIWSGIAPHDYFTWFLEVAPALIGCAILLIIYPHYKFTHLIYTLIFIHAVILLIGGHYTYAEVPLFNWIKDTFHQTRNNYDKVGHFAQGFIPAMMIREIFIRQSVFSNTKWMNVCVVSITLSISACYEFLEWAVALYSGESAEAFLGTQGYIWDTQADMLYATIGSISALILFSTLHNRLLSNHMTHEH